MPSEPFKKFKHRLKEVDEIVAARDAICPNGAGRPAQQKGAAVISGGTVLLSALFEGFLEEIYERAVDELYQSIPEADRKELKSHTSQKNNNANVHQVNTLFFYLGIPWVMSHQKLRWKKCSNSKVQEKLRNLSKARNQLAHGGSRIVRKQTLVAWRDFAERLANKLDEITADHIEDKLGNRPW